MNEDARRKREWVKTAAIIFLSVMLVLTFFSNTIMNYSLPEVAIQYVQSGTVTAKIRGSGVVESGDPYNIEVKESRKVASVAVRVGDFVEKGDVILYLEDEESEELKTAQEALEQAWKDYEKLLLSETTTAAGIQAANSNTSTASYRQQITNAQRAVTDAEKRVDELQQQSTAFATQIALTPSNDADMGDLLEQLNDARTNLENATYNRTAVQNRIDTLKAQQAQKELEIEANGDTATQDKLSEELIEIKKELIAANAAVEAAQNNVTVISTNKTALEGEQVKKKEELEASSDVNEQSKLKEELQAIEDNISAIKAELEEARTALTEATNRVSELSAQQKQKEFDLENMAATEAQLKLLKELQAIEKELLAAEAEFVSADAWARDAKLAFDMAETAYNNQKASGDTSDTIESLNRQKAAIDAELSKAQDTLKDKQEALTELVGSISNAYGLQDQMDAITKAQEKVDELTAKSIGATVTADISGTVTALNVTAGTTTSAATPVAVMQPEGKGFSMSFSVTNEQAKRLAVGDKADLVNAWRYDDVEVILASIKPDPDDPGQKKLLTFDVTGAVTAGQTLNISVGQKSANYDYIVPNNSIREDNNGKFILVVTSKSSPLGTRYVATRVDVEVLASDDSQSAVSSGMLTGYDPVITTSTKPVEAGKLVRLAEN